MTVAHRDPSFDAFVERLVEHLDVTDVALELLPDRPTSRVARLVALLRPAREPVPPEREPGSTEGLAGVGR